MKVLKWVYPKEDGSVGYEYCTRDEAIANRRKAMGDNERGKKLTDEQCLEDFIVIHWAEWVDEDDMVHE